MSIALIGYRGSGKSTIGRQLAAKLGWSFVDTDDEIVKRAGLSIRQIFDERGEPGFRDLESAAVADACAPSDHVIAFGGGAVLRPANREEIRKARLDVMYLRCEPEVLLQHIQADSNTSAARPHLTALGGGIDEIRKVLAEREPIYRSVMTHELDVTHLTPSQASDVIHQLIQQRA